MIQTIGYTDVTPDPMNANRQAMIDALMASNSLWYPLRYPAEYKGGKTINQEIHYHYPTAEDMQQILGLNNFRDFGGGNVYNASFGYIDQNPHNTMHIWTGGQNPEFAAPHSFVPHYVCEKPQTVDARDRGDPQLALMRNFAVTVKDRKFHSRSDLYSQPPLGDMFSNLTASYDSIFWPVHVNVDRMWWEWQTRNPTGLPYDLNSVLSPWSYTIRDMLDISRFGYEYVRCSFFMPVGIEAPIGRFVSAAIKVEPKARDFKQPKSICTGCAADAVLFVPRRSSMSPAQIRCAGCENPGLAGSSRDFGPSQSYSGPRPLRPATAGAAAVRPARAQS